MKHTALTILLVGVLALSAGALAVGAGASDGSHDGPHAVEATEPSLEEHDADGGQITYFRMSGRGNISNQYEIVEEHPGPPFVWDSESLSFGVSVTSESTENTRMVCGTIYDENETEVESLGCNSWNHTTPYRLSNFELEEWPSEANGTHYIVFEFIEQRPAEDGEGDGEDSSTEDVVLDSYQHEVYVISKEGDLAGNGISNAREVEVGTDFTKKDTSGNGLSDWEEMYRYGTDPLEEDTTGDGIDDGTIASMGLNPAIPYIVHLVATGTLLGMAAIAVTGLKFRRYLRNLDRTATTSPAASTSTTDNGTDDDAGPYGDRGIPSKEEEVFHIIHEHGGRMKQADLVDETDWSKATVSRLLSTLEEEGRVEKVRVGRGNVVMLTDEQTNDGVKP